MEIKIEIWSDVICPFCYMGKRKLELALQQNPIPHKIEWKSFLLDPSIPTHFEKPIHVYEYLANRKGISLAQSEELHKNVVHSAKQLGLEYNFSIAVVANTMNAHKTLHLAKKWNLQNEWKEKLLYSYFTMGKNIADPTTLQELGSEIGLPKNEILEVLESDQYQDEMEADIREAQELGIRGVPFFIFDRKYAISGAQDISVFQTALQKTQESST